MICRGNDQHAEVSRRLLESEILNNVLMIQVFQSLALQLQSLHDCYLTTVIPVALRPRDLNLFDCNHFTSGGVQRDVHLAIRPLADELSSNPFEDRCHVIISKIEPDRSPRNSRFGSEGDSAGVERAEDAFLTWSTVTSSTLLPQSFVLRFLSMLALFIEVILEVRSSFRLCSLATTRMDFLCFRLSGVGNGWAASADVGDVPPELASITGSSKSCSGKKSPRRSYISSAAGRKSSLNTLIRLFGCALNVLGGFVGGFGGLLEGGGYSGGMNGGT